MAAQCFKMAATAGDAEAQFITAYFLENGIGCDNDAEEARYWYEKSAEQGNPNAQEWLEKQK